METEERDATSRASFKCHHCPKTFTDLEADHLFDPASGEFRCYLCRWVVVEDQAAMPKTDTRLLLARFNEQMEPLYSLLQDVKDVKLAPSLLEPEPTDMSHLQRLYLVFMLKLKSLVIKFSLLTETQTESSKLGLVARTGLGKPQDRVVSGMKKLAWMSQLEMIQLPLKKKCAKNDQFGCLKAQSLRLEHWEIILKAVCLLHYQIRQVVFKTFKIFEDSLKYLNTQYVEVFCGFYCSFFSRKSISSKNYILSGKCYGCLLLSSFLIY